MASSFNVNHHGNEHKSELILFNTHYENFYFQNITTPAFDRALSSHFQQLSNGQRPMIGALADYSQYVQQLPVRHGQARSVRPFEECRKISHIHEIGTNQSTVSSAAESPHSTMSPQAPFIVYSGHNDATSSGSDSDLSPASPLDIDHLIERRVSLHFLLENALIEPFLLDRDGSGSRYLESMLKKGCKKQSVADPLLDYFMLIATSNTGQRLLCNPQSHSVLRLCIKHASSSKVHQFATRLLGHYQLLTLVMCPNGSRLIEEMLPLLRSQQLAVFAHQLGEEMLVQSNGMMARYLLNQQVCKILTRLIESKQIEYKYLQFLAHALESELALFCNHIYCCRVIQAFIQVYRGRLDVHKLFDNNGYVHVSISKYGNYVVQRLIEKSSNSSSYSDSDCYASFRRVFVDRVFSVQNLWTISQSKFGSNVVEMCIRVASRQQIDAFTLLLESNQAEILKKLLSHKYAHFVAKTLLNECGMHRYTQCVYHLIDAANQHLTLSHEEYKYGKFFIEQCRRLKQEMEQTLLFAQ
eukprot:CAMPEP_0197027056 /NCGR_PEP_ID=MMETSP1384-20130603/7043_1 /TAXON_ID=29189 /ORGANISM="Ammonia sp." /LENGTH=525 /DNA_ID=CAMNT_0042455847 /DNA_START=32 /DNA_END=1609 /DNA_ORIENTATION=-